MAILVIIILIYMSCSISAGIYLKSICRNRTALSSVSLTFDDGVDNIITPKILDVLKRYGAKGTFFIIGDKAKEHPDLVKRIVAEGHQIGNHSMHHKWSFPIGTTQKIYNEIMECNRILEDITERKNIYFRPPFGVTNPTLARAVRKSGLISIGWSIRSLDTMGMSIDKVENRVIKRLKGGDIILLHDNRAGGEQLVERILIKLRERELKAVTVEELIKTKEVC